MSYGHGAARQIHHAHELDHVIQTLRVEAELLPLPEVLQQYERELAMLSLSQSEHDPELLESELAEFFSALVPVVANELMLKLR